MKDKIKKLQCRIVGHRYSAAEIAVLTLRIDTNQHYHDKVLTCERCGHEELIPGPDIVKPEMPPMTANSGATFYFPPRETITA